MSFGNTIAKWKNSGGPGRRSPWALTVNGQITRIINWGMPESEGHVDHGDQLYFLDNLEGAVEARIRRAEQSSQEKPLPEILTILEEYLRAKNPYAASFRMLNEVLRSRRTSDIAQTTNIILAINPVPADIGWRKRRVPLSERYFGDTVDVPVSNDVAAVFIGEVPRMSYDARVTLRQEGDQFVRAEGHTTMDRILFNSSSTDQFCYPLIHLHGEGAWAADSESSLGRGRRYGREDRAPTLRQYYAYRL